MDNTTAHQLQRLIETKEDIRSAIAAKGQPVADSEPFVSYGDKIRAIETGSTPVSSMAYIRPADWLPMPTDIEEDTSLDKAYMLAAVYPYGYNAIAFEVSTSTGYYTVTWGDGSRDIADSGTDAVHRYVYSSLPESSYCERGYRQAMITVYSSDSQGNAQGYITGMILGKGVEPLTSGYAVSPVLEFKARCTNITQFTTRGAYASNTAYAQLLLMEKFTMLGTTNITQSCAYIFNQCYGLQEAAIDLSKSINLNYAFASCNLVKMSLDASAATNLERCFNGCNNLRELTVMSPVCTRYSYFVGGCRVLTELEINVGSNTSLQTSAFSNLAGTCYNLRSLRIYGMTSIVNNVSINNTAIAHKELMALAEDLPSRTGLSSAGRFSILETPGAFALTEEDIEYITNKNWTVLM